MPMNIEVFEVGPFYENTYLLEQNSAAILIDPGFYNDGEFAEFTRHLERSGATLQAIVLTHAHVDHVLGLQRTLKLFDVPVYLNTDDLFLWENFGNQATMFGLNQVGFSFTPEALPASGKIKIGDFEFECLYTPGHSPDHTAFYFEQDQVCIAGDALFKESVGRTDLYKGDFELLAHSIKERLYTLPDSTVIYPGHGPTTTIGNEKVNNPFVTA
jgi:hydroxyacylglutathione hydrolase